MTLTHELRVQFPARDPCFESHSLLYSKPRGYRFEAFNSLMRSGFNSRQGIHISNAIQLLYSKPRGYRFEAINSLMRIEFLYYNCLGFGLASDYTDVVLNTVLDIVGVRI